MGPDDVDAVEDDLADERQGVLASLQQGLRHSLFLVRKPPSTLRQSPILAPTPF
jgi:hypothetical protein